MSYRCNSCGCDHPSCDPCSNVITSGCPVQLDFSCSFYHKNNNAISQLSGLGLSNGATLELVIETIDQKIRQINVLDTPLPTLRALFTINTLQQFLTGVDTQLGVLKVWLGNLNADPSIIQDGSYWYRTDSGQLKIKLNGSIRLISIT